MFLSPVSAASSKHGHSRLHWPQSGIWQCTCLKTCKCLTVNKPWRHRLPTRKPQEVPSTSSPSAVAWFRWWLHLVVCCPAAITPKTPDRHPQPTWETLPKAIVLNAVQLQLRIFVCVRVRSEMWTFMQIQNLFCMEYSSHEKQLIMHNYFYWGDKFNIFGKVMTFFPILFNPVCASFHSIF